MNLADLYSALADPTRLRVLELLHEKALPVHQLAGAFDISRPAISRHLRVLKEAGLVQELKQGRENLYSFQRDQLKSGISWLEQHQGRAKTKAKARIVKPVAAVVEPTAVPEPMVIVPVSAAEPVVVAKPKLAKPAKPKATKPATEPVAPPPPKQPTPQLSLFDF